MRRRTRPARSVKPPSDAGPAAGLAAYANQFEVGYNAFEFLLDFSQDYADPGGDGVAATPAHAHTRIVTAPAYAKAFLDLLDRSIVDYEAQFGAIASAASTTPSAPTATANGEEVE
jgi:hypothetical protein